MLDLYKSMKNYFQWLCSLHSTDNSFKYSAGYLIIIIFYNSSYNDNA
nr:hypothetical protein BAR15_160053 [Bartonella sp. AR 15-3]